jgi:hypothetical protein
MNDKKAKSRGQTRRAYLGLIDSPARDSPTRYLIYAFTKLPLHTNKPHGP